MNAPRELDWTTANQHLLVAEFARLRARLGEGEVAEAEQQVDSAAQCLPGPSAIDTLVALFELSDFERDVLLLAAGAEMDARLAALCGEATGQSQRPWATFGLALAVLPDPHWSALTPVAPLRRWRLIEVDESAGLTAARLKLDERVLHFIAGLNYLDHRLAALLEAVPPASLMADAHRDIAERAADQLAEQAGRLPTVMLSGDDPDGQRDVAATLAQTLGVALFALRAADIPAAAHEQASLISLWQREAALLGAGLLIVQGDDAAPGALSRFI
ncbi:MAG: ATP-binding protein, partial [Ottowia sp.]|nr:ATP-binding protein [Ottowia sp.]